MNTGNYQKSYEIEESSKKNDSMESTLAEKIASLLEGEVRAKEEMAHKTMQIMSQKDLELAGLNEKIRLLESFRNENRNSDSFDGLSPRPPRQYNKPEYFNDFEELKNGRCSPDSGASLNSDVGEEKGDIKNKDIKYGGMPSENLPPDDLRTLHILNTKLLSAIYNDSQLRKDEQVNFMKIITQLSDVVKELKDQNNTSHFVEKSNDKTLEQHLVLDNQYGRTSSPTASPHKTLAEREYDSPPNPLELPSGQHLTSSWDQVYNSNNSTNSNHSSIPKSENTLVSHCHRSSEYSRKLEKEKNKFFPKKLQNMFLHDRFRNISMKLRKQENCLTKTRVGLKHFQEQGKFLMSIVEEIKHDQEKEKLILESLMCKIDKIGGNDASPSVAMKELDDRIAKIELRLIEHSSKLVNKDKEVIKLMEKLKQANLIKDEYQNKTIQLSTEISNLSTKLAANKTQTEELKEAIRKEKTLNVSMKKAYEINLKNLVGNTVQEQRHLVEELKMSFDNNIVALQTENSELKARICQMEEESKKICNDSKIRVVKAKKQLYSQASIASQKLLKADSKIKEFYCALEKLMKGIYYRLYEAELEQIKKKCHEEGGVQAASYILGVSATQMSRVLAAEAIPSFHDWMECCKRLVYREKFAEELAGFILSLFWPILPKDIAKGPADS